MKNLYLKIQIFNSVIDFQSAYCIAYYKVYYLWLPYICTYISYEATLNQSLQVFDQDSWVVGFEFKRVILYLPIYKRKYF